MLESLSNCSPNSRLCPVYAPLRFNPVGTDNRNTFIRTCMWELGAPAKATKKLGRDKEYLTQDDFQQFRADCLSCFPDTQENIKCVMDKLPHNFLYIGFICTALPEAKIIHVKRDARATCWSVFRRRFSESGIGYSNDLNDTVQFYRMYHEIMEFWHEKFPGRIFDINYEMLTESQEAESRRVIEHLDLEWEDACLEFYKGEGRVKTASFQQVRQKMYTGSSDAWQNYKPYLVEMLAELEGLY